MELIFDIGMYDGADTAYYLQSGNRVVAVEANEFLVRKARDRFARELASGQLTCVHAAITENDGVTTLTLSGRDLGSSSLFGEKIAHMQPVGAVEVQGVRLGNLFDQFGIPKYMKVDIEGADRFCVLPLTQQNRPKFISFEVGDDAEELLSHAVAIGYKKFKVINQNTFREFANVECLYDRAARRVMRYLGYAEPLMIRRAGRFFAAGRSSGPVPWQSDGKWRSFEEARAILRNERLPGWNDVHAAVE